MATSASPTFTRYRWTGTSFEPLSRDFKIVAFPGESIASFLERACTQHLWFVADEITFVLRGRHITEARIARAPEASVQTTISVHTALRSACREVAEYARGETRFAINEDGVLIHQQSTFFVERRGDDEERLAHRLGLDVYDDVDISVGETPTAQVLRYVLRTGELLARHV